ncbi:MAG: hypothetical protein O9346_13485 [Leptospiraceae bacterium]|nr:hypothetical protein [Leptospiraceae bacterium]MCZ8347423.1 hypothetical protein [Leptospiraceae bacterium]
MRDPITARTLQKTVRSWGQITVSGRTIHPHIRYRVAQRVMDKYRSVTTYKLLAHVIAITTAK